MPQNPLPTAGSHPTNRWLKLRAALAGVAVAATAGGVAAVQAPSAQAAAATYSLWSGSHPRVTVVHLHRPVELGTRVSAGVTGRIVGLRFYKVATDHGRHVGHLWSPTGRLLASVTFTHETRSGWQTAHFARPVSIHPHLLYTASYHSSTGTAPMSRFYFARSAHHSTGTLLTAPAGRNGVYTPTHSGYPTHSRNSTNYWIDALFVPSATATSSSPSGYPSASTTGVPSGTRLRTVTGDYTVSRSGAVVSGLDITGRLVVKADHVTVKNSRVRCSGASDW